MARPLGAAAVLLLLPSLVVAGQEMPSCSQLSSLWQNRFYGLLKPDWAKRPLRCDLIDTGRYSELQRKEEIDVTVARAAYILDKTEWARTSPAFKKPFVSYGGISAPPDSMLEYVSARTTGVVYNRSLSGAMRDMNNGRIHLGGDNFNSKAVLDGLDGMHLAGQLVHEARHADELHHLCPGQAAGETPNCDLTITEEFYGGGSHGVAAIWLAWIANYSTWPASFRKAAQKSALWVMGPEGARINDRASADLWTCRYFATRVWETKKKCP